MLEPNPKKRITAKESMKYEYISLCERIVNVSSEEDGNIGEIDDKPGLNVRI